MELKPNTYYRTRDGRKAYVSAVFEPNPFTKEAPRHLCGGYIEGRSNGIYGWKADGTCRGYDDSHEGSHDLIEEWREPRTASCKYECVLVECDKYVGVQVRIEGSECSKCRIIGRKTVEVSITEGEGL